MGTMDHHDARGPEETMQNLSPVVPAGSASRSPSTGLRQCGLSDRPAAEDASELAQPENPGYVIAWRIDRRATQPQQPPEPLRLPAPLDRLP